ncbi:CDGSH iron-sulfur domain-containing protein [Catenulispora sp. EB89]|uniref:CDGSH iron-sulfur domain-containing protein n=1 Tax=Catenulispora sp. EB89 TaxID=3156257 RepID=UPI003511A9AA
MADASPEPATRVTVSTEGPVLIDGPVDVELPDGRTVSSGRVVVALCTCRRSRIYPWCDASHRDRSRSQPDGQ